MTSEHNVVLYVNDINNETKQPGDVKEIVNGQTC